MDNLDYTIDKVINESIDNMLLNESLYTSLGGWLSDYFKRKKSSDSDKKDDEKKKKKKKSEKKRRKKKNGVAKKLRRTKNGGKVYYDYDDYERKHRKIGKGDADSIRNMIDQDNTDIAAVARLVFPYHTDEGAQSQLRKILNGERPMTKDIAAKLSKLISRGKIAVK